MTDKVYIHTCRACLDTNYRKSVTLTQDDWMELYNFCLNQEISDCDMNLTLCLKCSQMLKKFAKFKKQCHESEEFWRSLLQNKMICNLNKIDSSDDMADESNVKLEDDIKIELEEPKYDNSQYLTKYSPSIPDNDFEDDHFDNTPIIEDIVESDHLLSGIKDEEIHYEEKSVATEINEFENETKPTTKFNGSCDACGKMYKRKKSLSKHIIKCKIKKNKEQFNRCPHKTYGDGRCLFCQYNEKNDLNKKFKGVCDKCAKVFATKDYLIQHIRKCSKLKVNFPFCGICKHNPDEKDEKDHLRQHYENNDLKCQICNYIGKDFAQMISHRYLHYPSGPVATDEIAYRMPSCILCPTKVKKPRWAEFHFRKEHLNTSGGRCRYCDVTLRQIKVWRYHERAHVVRGPDCPVCGKSFMHMRSLNHHLSFKHSNELHLICDMCGKLFNKNYNLQDHITNVHKVVRPEPCDHCGKTFKNIKYLKKHQGRISKGRTICCPLCSKKFYNKTSLRIHSHSHSEQRPYKCELCDCSYKYAAHLAVHTKRHKGDYSFKCTECNSAFVTSTQLKRHASVHTGVRRHKCKHCDRSFHNPSMLKDHCLKRHPNDIK